MIGFQFKIINPSTGFSKVWWGSFGEVCQHHRKERLNFNKLAKIESDLAYQSRPIFFLIFLTFVCLGGGASDTSVCKILLLCRAVSLRLGHNSMEKTLSVIVERTSNSDLIRGIFKNPFHCSHVSSHSWLTRVSPSANLACWLLTHNCFKLKCENLKGFETKCKTNWEAKNVFFIFSLKWGELRIKVFPVTHSVTLIIWIKKISLIDSPMNRHLFLQFEFFLLLRAGDRASFASNDVASTQFFPEIALFPSKPRALGRGTSSNPTWTLQCR